jgi:hypothetical protein
MIRPLVIMRHITQDSNKRKPKEKSHMIWTNLMRVWVGSNNGILIKMGVITMIYMPEYN